MKVCSLVYLVNAHQDTVSYETLQNILRSLHLQKDFSTYIQKNSLFPSHVVQGIKIIWSQRLIDCWPLMASVYYTVKILKIGTPEIITIIVLQLEHLDFTVQYCVQKMQTE